MNMCWGRFGLAIDEMEGEPIDVLDLDPAMPEIPVTELDAATATGGEALTPSGTFALIEYRTWISNMRARAARRRAGKLLANQAGIKDELPQYQVAKPATWPKWAKYLGLGLVGWFILRRIY